MAPNSKIIIITTHSELSHLTFSYKLEALDYILKDSKDEIRNKVKDCLDHIESLQLNTNTQDTYIFKDGESMKVVNISDILYFETSHKPHRVIMHLKNGEIEFYSSISEIIKNERFKRCHESIAINPENIVKINKKSRIITMVNGEEVVTSKRLIKNLLK